MILMLIICLIAGCHWNVFIFFWHLQQ